VKNLLHIGLCCLLVTACSAEVATPELLEVRQRFQCDLGAESNVEHISFSGEVSAISSKLCGCAQKAMSADIMRPEFSEQKIKLERLLVERAGMPSEDLEKDEVKDMVFLGSLVNMSKKLYRDGAPSANEGLEAAVNFKPTTLGADCDASYSDFRLMEQK